MSKYNDLPLETILQVFDYNLEEGKLLWKRPLGNKTKPGTEAGTLNSQGYIQIQYAGTVYRAHRILYTIITGQPPSNEIDHINGDRTDNRISNLRSVTKTENMRNTRLQSRNNTGITGVSKTPQGKFDARITINSRAVHLGRYSTLAEATAARKAASQLHDFHPNHGTI